MSNTLDHRIVTELHETFKEHTNSGDKLSLDQLGELFKDCGDPVPNFKLRELMEQFDTNKSGHINFEQFLEMFVSLGSNKTYGAKLRAHINTKSGITVSETSAKSAAGTVHSVASSETKAFSTYINRMLVKDEHCKPYLPIDVNKESDLFEKLSNGVILCKLINAAVENTIDVRTINTKKLSAFTITENLNLALNSAKAIGIHIVNIGSQDIIEKTPHLVLGIVWQIIRLVLFAKINIKDNPKLACLLMEGETLEMLLSMSPEDVLLRWVNYQLAKTTTNKRMTNFTSDVKDSEIYAFLMEKVVDKPLPFAPGQVLSESNLTKRAEKIIGNADVAECTGLLIESDIVNGNPRLNLAFVANLFNLYPCLDEVEPMEVIEETREEKTYRNWMNSLGVSPKVNYLYTDLSDGLVYAQLMDMISPGTLNQSKVNRPPFKTASANIKKTENCNMVVEAGKALKFSLVGIAGNDLYDGNKTLSLALLSQMMRAYTFKVLQDLSADKKPISDKEIVEWANAKCKTKIQSFKDPAIHNSVPVIELINAIAPGTAMENYVLPNPKDDEEKLKNAMYAVSCGRKMGAQIYALPEDIVEGKFKMITTIYACLMARDLKGKA